MKKSISVLAALVAIVLFGCKENPYITSPGDNSKNYDSIPVYKADTNGIVVSVDSAVAICHALRRDAETAERYKISGQITAIKTDLSKVPGTYTNIDFTLSSPTENITCFRTNYLNNYPFSNSKDMPREGSKVTVIGNLVNYNGNTPEVKNCFIVRVDSLVTAE